MFDHGSWKLAIEDEITHLLASGCGGDDLDVICFYLSLCIHDYWNFCYHGWWHFELNSYHMCSSFSFMSPLKCVLLVFVVFINVGLLHVCCFNSCFD